MISFLQNRIVPKYELEVVEISDIDGKYVFTNKEGIDKLQELGLRVKEIQTFPDFRITTLNGTFFNKKTRHKETETKYLLYVN